MKSYLYTGNDLIRYTDPMGMSNDDIIINNNKEGNEIARILMDTGDYDYVFDTNIDYSTDSPHILDFDKIKKESKEKFDATSWGTLFNEWDQGTGAEKSMFADFDNTSTGVFGSFDNAFSTYSGKARSAVLSEGKSKGPVRSDYGDINPLTAGFDGWEQFIGRASLSYYKLGDKVLYMMNDSKSMTSFMYRMSPSWDRSDFRLNGNTHQTYIWTETMSEVKQKAQTRLNWNQRIQQSRQEYKNTESQRLPAIKW